MARNFSNNRFSASTDFMGNLVDFGEMAYNAAAQNAYTKAIELNTIARGLQARQDGELILEDIARSGQNALQTADRNFWPGLFREGIGAAAGAVASRIPFGGNGVNDLSGLDYNDPTNFSYNAAPKYLDTPDIDTSWGGWDSI